MEDWQGKVVIFYAREGGGPAKEGGVPLESPRMIERCGETIVIGTVPSDAEDWAGGLRSAVRWSDVVYYLEFPNREDYLERIRAAAGRRERSLH